MNRQIKTRPLTLEEQGSLLDGYVVDELNNKRKIIIDDIKEVTRVTSKKNILTGEWEEL